MKRHGMDAAETLLGGHDVPKKEIKHIITSKAANGGFVHEHHHTHPEHHKAETHISPDMDALHDHMEEHMGEPNPGEAEANAGQSGIPEGMIPGAPQVGGQ